MTLPISFSPLTTFLPLPIDPKIKSAKTPQTNLVLGTLKDIDQVQKCSPSLTGHPISPMGASFPLYPDFEGKYPFLKKNAELGVSSRVPSLSMPSFKLLT